LIIPNRANEFLGKEFHISFKIKSDKQRNVIILVVISFSLKISKNAQDSQNLTILKITPFSENILELWVNSEVAPKDISNSKRSSPIIPRNLKNKTIFLFIKKGILSNC